MTAKKPKLDEKYVQFRIQSLESSLEDSFVELEGLRARFKDMPAEIVQSIGLQVIVSNIQSLIISIRAAKAGARWSKGEF
jgi:hypothetical protein